MAEKRITAAEVAKEVEQIKVRIAQIEKETKEAAVAANETHQKVSQLYDALIMPEPGQEHGLLHRTAKVATAIESGERVAGWAVKIASVLAAIGVIAASIKIGIWPETGP